MQFLFEEMSPALNRCGSATFIGMHGEKKNVGGEKRLLVVNNLAVVLLSSSIIYIKTIKTEAITSIGMCDDNTYDNLTTLPPRHH